MIMHDGSRHFAALPETAGSDELVSHLKKLEGARKTGFLTDFITEVWIDFTYGGQSFTINNQYGEYWFFVRNPSCPEQLLLKVALHFSQLLGSNS